MGQCAHRNEVDTLLGIVADGIEGDAATGLRLIATGNDIDGLLGIGHGEIVEHDTVDTTMIQHLLEFLEGTNLNLNLQVETFLFEIGVTTVDGIDNTSGKVDMIVLQQNHIEKTDAVVASATNLNSLLLQHAHARSSFAGVEHAGLGALQMLYILVGHGGNTTHALHDVEHKTLGLQQGASLTGNNHGYVALLDTGTILHQHLDLHVGVETMEHLLGNLDASQDAVFLDEQMALAHGILRNTAQSGVVAVTNIFSERQVDESVYKLLNIHVVVGPVEIDT